MIKKKHVFFYKKLFWFPLLLIKKNNAINKKNTLIKMHE
jgi:hypothetical protein